MLDTERVMEFENLSLDNINRVARSILDNAEIKICLFIGEMGSGKTTLVREVCELLEVEDNVASPTFSLVNEYKAKEGPVYHFDFYRVDSLEEALDAGVEDYFYSGDLCLIEWPELVKPILPDKYLTVEIDNFDKSNRTYKITTHDSNEAHRL